MTLKDARGAYDYFSGKLSDLVRQLSFAGIAVVWMFRTQVDKMPFDDRLMAPLKFLVSALALDLFHYILASLIWSRYAHCREKDGIKDSDEISPHEAINWPMLVCFWGKVFFCFMAYVVMLICLWNRF